MPHFGMKRGTRLVSRLRSEIRCAAGLKLLSYLYQLLETCCNPTILLFSLQSLRSRSHLSSGYTVARHTRRSRHRTPGAGGMYDDRSTAFHYALSHARRTASHGDTDPLIRLRGIATRFLTDAKHLNDSVTFAYCSQQSQRQKTHCRMIDVACRSWQENRTC